MEDLPQYLFDHVGTYVFYSFCPRRPANGKGEYTWYLQEDGTINVSLSGGGNYPNQKLWDFSGDSVCVDGWRGAARARVRYDVIHRDCPLGHHSIFVLVPHSQAVRTFGALPLGRPLSRRSFLDGGYGVIKRVEQTGVVFSICEVGSLASYDVQAEHVAALRAMHAQSRTSISPHTVKELSGEKNLLSAVVVGYVRDTASQPGAVHASASFVEHVARGDVYFGEQSKQMLVAHSDPFLAAPGLGVVVDEYAERNSVLERVEKPRSTIVEVTPFVDETINMLVSMISKGREHSLHPVDDDTIYSRQYRPTQMNILDRAADSFLIAPFTSFIKREPIKKPEKAARLITVVDPVTKYEYARYYYAIESVLKEQPWYCFGIPPSEVAQRVGRLCEGEESVTCTDFSYFDATKNIIEHMLDVRIHLALFSREYAAELLEILEALKDRTVRTQFGVKYEQGKGQASGDNKTSASNSWSNVLFCLLAYRTQKNSAGAFPSREDCENFVNTCVLAAGDDGVQKCLSDEAITKAAVTMGKLVKLERTHATPIAELDAGKVPQGYVNFLARVYTPYVFHGHVDSCCDVPRTLRGLHMSTNTDSKFSNSTVAYTRATNLRLSDANTPLVRDIVRAWIAACPLDDDFAGVAEDLKSYSRKEFTDDVQYPNGNDDYWMRDYIEMVLPDWGLTALPRWAQEVLTAAQEGDRQGAAKWRSPPLVSFDEHTWPQDTTKVVFCDGKVVAC